MTVNHTRHTATAQRRQRQIEDCLFENLLHTPWQSISVADICRQVGISRKAFYNYYHDKDDCFCAIIDRLLQESMLHAARIATEDSTPLESAILLLDYWKEQRAFFDIIVRNDLLYLLLKRNVECVLRENSNLLALLSTHELETDTDILACFTAVQLTLILQWYARGFDTPTEEMARKLLRILYDPMLPQT